MGVEEGDVPEPEGGRRVKWRFIEVVLGQTSLDGGGSFEVNPEVYPCRCPGGFLHHTWYAHKPPPTRARSQDLLDHTFHPG